MSTEAQLAANRANALKSTGPRTPEGKARAAANSLSHGLTATAVLLPDEDPADYQLFREGMLAELAPETTLDHYFAENIIASAWRLRRVAGIEVRLQTPIETESEIPIAPQQIAAVWLDTDLSSKLANLSRHEAHIHRILCRDLNAYYRRRQLQSNKLQPKPEPQPKRPLMHRFGDLLSELERDTNRALKQAGIDPREANDDLL